MKKNISNKDGPVPGPGPAHLYFVKSGETLESISWDLNIQNPGYLRKYHNARCSSLDLIPEDGRLRFLQKLYVPIPDEIAGINRKIRERGESLCYLLPHGKIPFNIRSVNGDYSVMHAESEDGIRKYEYAYLIHFNYIREDEEKHYIRFSMSSFRKNGTEPEEKINGLASDLVNIIYPVTLTADRTGNFIAAKPDKEIKEIIARIEGLKKYHTGPYAALHTDQMKSKVKNPEMIYDHLKKLMCIQFLFGHFYQADYQSTDTAAPYPEEFSWLAPASPVRMKMTHQTLPQKDARYMEILQKGRSADYRTIQELYASHGAYDEQIKPHGKSLQGEHTAKYTLNFHDFSIRKIDAEFEMQIAGYEKKLTFRLEKLTE